MISISEAAQRLGLERSTLSRYVKQHADALAPQKSGRETLVDFDALKAHRDENIRLAEAAPAARARHPGGRNDEQAMRTRVQRQIGELDLADRLRLTVPRAEVEDAGVAAVSAMRNAFDLSLEGAAESIGALTRTEPRLIRPALRQLCARALDAFVRQLQEREIVAPGATEADEEALA